MKRFLLALLIACAMLSGCGSEQTVSEDPVCLPVFPEPVMQSAQTVLLKMHFDIEKYDTSARYIRTRPLSGAQFFEFWRRDNASASAMAQANLHTLRRIVELEFTPQDATTCIQCRVQVSRLSMSEKPIEGAGRMSGIYTESSTRYQTLEVGSQDQSQIEWVEIGRDYDLEHKILGLISEKY
ncbi:MAG: hypothetical protein ACYSOW_07350 [Planctomycetota bacterium]|jgi:hypothetical protein